MARQFNTSSRDFQDNTASSEKVDFYVSTIYKQGDREISFKINIEEYKAFVWYREITELLEEIVNG